MADASNAVKLIVGLVVLALIAAFLIPVAVDPIAGPEEANGVTLDTGNSTELQPNLTATLDSVDTTGDNATYTVNASGDTSTVTVDNGTNETVTVDGEDVTIAVTDVSTGQATADFSYPGTYGWGGGASALWAILPLIIVLAVFLFIAMIAIQQM